MPLVFSFDLCQFRPHAVELSCRLALHIGVNSVVTGGCYVLCFGMRYYYYKGSVRSCNGLDRYCTHVEIL